MELSEESMFSVTNKKSRVSPARGESKEEAWSRQRSPQPRGKVMGTK